jgi:hypothetical protein
MPGCSVLGESERRAFRAVEVAGSVKRGSRRGGNAVVCIRDPRWRRSPRSSRRSCRSSGSEAVAASPTRCRCVQSRWCFCPCPTGTLYRVEKHVPTLELLRRRRVEIRPGSAGSSNHGSGWLRDRVLIIDANACVALPARLGCRHGVSGFLGGSGASSVCGFRFGGSARASR